MTPVVLQTFDHPRAPLTLTTLEQLRESSSLQLRRGGAGGERVVQYTAVNAVAGIRLHETPANPVNARAELVVQVGKHTVILAQASQLLTNAGPHTFPILKSTHVLAQRAQLRWRLSTSSGTAAVGVSLFGEIAGGFPYAGTA